MTDRQYALEQVTIAQAQLALARQRVRECELDHKRGVFYTRAEATVAADRLEAALAKLQD